MQNKIASEIESLEKQLAALRESLVPEEKYNTSQWEALRRSVKALAAKVRDLCKAS